MGTERLGNTASHEQSQDPHSVSLNPELQLGRVGVLESKSALHITNLGLRALLLHEVETVPKKEKPAPKGQCPEISRVTHHCLSLIGSAPEYFFCTC